MMNANEFDMWSSTYNYVKIFIDPKGVIGSRIQV
jgi:hypothetical protein